MSNKALLQYWIIEREKVRLKKEAGEPKPWSTDPIFQATYFTNVNREHDRVTRWIREFYTPHVHDEYFEANMCVARLFNWPDTLEKLGYIKFEGCFDWIYDVTTEIQRKGIKVWGSAYLVTTHGRAMSKAEYCSEVLQTAFGHGLRHRLGHTLQSAHTALQKVEGFGSFMAAQVVADLKNTPGHPLQKAPDWRWWSAPGPGSLRGLGWYFDEKITPGHYQEAIEQVAKDLDWFMWPGDLCMQNLQNCLCEYDKMMRIRTGTGRSKRGYDAS